MKTMRGPWIAAASLALVAVVVSVGFALRSRTEVPVAAPKQAPEPVKEVLSGRIQPQQMISLKAPVEGKLLQVIVEPGQEVYSSQLLAQLENAKLAVAQAGAQEEAVKTQDRIRDLSADLAAARLEVSSSTADAIRGHTKLADAEKEYLRQQKMDSVGATPHLTFLRAEETYKSAKTDVVDLETLAQRARRRVDTVTRQLEEARGALQDKKDDFSSIQTLSEIRSPVDGTIISSQGKVGDRVYADQSELFQIAVNLSLLDVLVNVGSKQVALGDSAAVRIAEAGDVEIPGTVRELGTGQALIGFDSPSPAVKPGMTALVLLKSAVKRNEQK